MIRNWILTAPFLGVDAIAFPDKKILIPITIKHKEVPDFTLNQWLVANVYNAIRVNSNTYEIVLACYEYGSQTPEIKYFKKKTTAKIACNILSITEKTFRKILPEIPTRYKGDMYIQECPSYGSGLHYVQERKYWILKSGNKKIIL